METDWRNRYRIKAVGFAVPAITGRTVELQPKQRADHYGTPDHVAWRLAIVARAGGMCEQCGRDRCRLYADHIRELQDGGDPLDLANGQALCGSCHLKKTNAERRKRR